MEFRSELPAVGASRPARWLAEADECRAHPGQWALLTTLTVPRDATTAERKRVGSHARMIAHHVRTGRYVAFRPAGEFESSSRTATNAFTGEIRAMVYVRFGRAEASSDTL
jgi:hypothetical protein